MFLFVLVASQPTLNKSQLPTSVKVLHALASAPFILYDLLCLPSVPWTHQDRCIPGLSQDGYFPRSSHGCSSSSFRSPESHSQPAMATLTTSAVAFIYISYIYIYLKQYYFFKYYVFKFLAFLPLNWNKFWESRALSCYSLLQSYCLYEYLAYSRCSINIVLEAD